MPKATVNEDSFHRKSIRKIQQWLRSDSDESLRDENEKLCQELDELLTAYKQVKQAVDRLRSDYELARRAVLFRQYTMLKSAVKRAAMLVRLQADQGANVSEVHLELNGSIKTSTFAKAGNKRSEAQRKREERRKDMCSEDLEDENDELSRDLKISRTRLAAMQDFIRDMAESYDDSKRLLPWNRYRALHKMIKIVLDDQIMNDNLLAQLHSY